MTQSSIRPDRGPRNPIRQPVREGGKGDGIPAKLDNPVVVQKVFRLSYDQYVLIEKKVGHIQVGDNTTPESVAYQLGIQKVLSILRSDIVIDPL